MSLGAILTLIPQWLALSDYPSRHKWELKAMLPSSMPPTRVRKVKKMLEPFLPSKK